MEISAGVTQFVRQHFGAGVEAKVQPLRGGLEAEGISRIFVQRGGASMASFVAKPFCGAGCRELEIYRGLATASQLRLAPELLGCSYTDEKRTAGYLFLEWVPARQRWPWADPIHAGHVVDRLAALHRLDPAGLRQITGDWDYEAELMRSAQATAEFYRSVLVQGLRPSARPMVQALERVVERLPQLRRELMGFAGVAPVHGDAHPGNVVLRGEAAVLLDWGRARIGSPLEDLSSWVHSLAFWEPQARRRHDTLLARYRTACGGSASLSRDYRDALVLAGASNALAGALRYHLAVVGDASRSPRQQVNSFRAAADWLRIIRRADTCLRC